MADGDDDIYTSFQNNNQQQGWGGTIGGQQQNPLGATNANPLMRPPPSGYAPQQQVPGSGWGQRPPGSQYGGGGGVGGNDARPMTSNRASGFSQQQGASFDPTGQGTKFSGPAPPLQKRSENSDEERCMEQERRVNTLIEESAVAAMQGDYGNALEKAKEAGRRERQLTKQREQLQLADAVNIDLTYAVYFNLAVQFHRNQMHTDALNTYSLIVRNKQYSQSGRLRVNMGNIYGEQNKYLLAIKMYRLALEEIPQTSRELRFKVQRNIGNAYVKEGHYGDAINAYETVLDGNPDMITGFNLLLCYYAVNEVDKMKRTFTKLLSIKSQTLSGLGDDDEEDGEEKDVLVHDALKAEVRERKKQYTNYIVTAARLIAPVLDKDWRIGFDYVIEQLRHYESKDQQAKLASELEMCKATNYLKYKKYREAIDGLKSFEKKDQVLRARSATNLSYLYFLEGDYDSGEKYADVALEDDRYNAKALVNKGNFHYVRGEFEKARQYYADALKSESDCIEAMYNRGLAKKQLGNYDDALDDFTRLQSLIDSVEVIYQIADLHDIKGEERATESFHRLITRVPTDPNVLARLGLLNSKQKQEVQAFHYYLEAYRYYQVNMDVISWLGAYFVKNEVYDKAMQFFERAAQIQPQQVKWQMMVASCHRRRGEYPQAKRMYEDIHRRHPDNVDCLKYLVHLCNDFGWREEGKMWNEKLHRLETKLQIAEGSGGNLASSTDQFSSSNPNIMSSEQSVQRNRGGSEEGGASAKRHAKQQRQQQQQQDDDDDDDVALPGT